MNLDQLAFKPLPRRCPPAYPTKLEILARPHLLERRLPPAWAGNREIAAAVGVFLAAGAGGCQRETSLQGGSSVKTTPDMAAVVAPVFEHGIGRVSVGCVAITPPALLSEDEALAIIADEMARAGVQMSRRDVTLTGVLIEGQEYQQGYEWVAARMGIGWQDVTRPLVVDLADPQHFIHVEFVSREDFRPLGGKTRYFGTAGGIELKDVAKSIVEEVGKQGRNIYFGAFYEPAVYPDWKAAREHMDDEMARTDSSDGRQLLYENWHEKANESCVRQTDELLRLQVRDFVDWLKAQGAI
jgi:hypothetical protein